MPCLSIRDALRTAEFNAAKLGLAMAIYCENNLLVVRILPKVRTGLELEVVNP